MANRVALGALPGGGYGLRVSRPGVNVLSTGLAPSQLSFDSDWLRTLKVHMSGSIAVPAATSYPQYTSVSLGETFPEPPICFAWVTNPTGVWAIPGQHKFMDQSMVGYVSGWTNEAVVTGCRITTTQIQFLRSLPSGNFGAYTARYIVLKGA